ncbi:MAG: anti-sigma factor antagonist [Clostridiales bacterium]|nr:anti-sigma factor antagonist [Clostridiales bacterium]
MKTTIQNNELTIYLCGRIDANNSEDIECEIFSAVDGSNSSDIVIDARELEYISSAGLRILMKLLKRINRQIPVINVSRDVYDIFETTGFTELFDVKRAMREISVEGCDIIGQGFYGTVYRVDSETIVKVYESPDCLPMIQNEQRLAKLAFIKGVPTAISYDTVRVGGSYGSVFELLKAKSFNDLMKKDPGNFDTLMRKYVGFIKTVHSTEMDSGSLPMAKNKFISYLDAIRRYISNEQHKRLNELISGLPDDLHLVHGDLHMKNIMVTDNEPMLIDMDTISTGQPLFDLQALYVSYIAFPEDDPDNLLSFFGIPNELGKRIWNTIIELYFDTTDEKRIAGINNKIKLLAMVRFLYILSLADPKDNELNEKRIKRSQDNIAELIGSVVDLNI